jgi:hypothetical protein
VTLRFRETQHSHRASETLCHQPAQAPWPFAKEQQEILAMDSPLPVGAGGHGQSSSFSFPPWLLREARADTNSPPAPRHPQLAYIKRMGEIRWVGLTARVQDHP